MVKSGSRAYGEGAISYFFDSESVFDELAGVGLLQHGHGVAFAFAHEEVSVALFQLLGRGLDALGGLQGLGNQSSIAESTTVAVMS